ncbi:kinase-like protein [Exidia glandulosa HHB12029]|uniref:Kinase-like protein n=1 Tax=Exidia glandulosa HHB12029 TaxID=1314781 RepID=A0A165GKG3_EXIGL|nr:kinase-like protein [Exidia glandulosa HHB12029]
MGGLSDVYRGTWSAPNGPDVPVALKVVRLPGASRERVLNKLEHEFLVWKTLRHPNILELCGIHLGLGEYPAMVSPWCKGGDIVSYLKKHENGPNIKDLKLKALVEVLQGLQYLHERDPPIVHGDLKGANILVSTTGEALLCDFGLASVFDEHSTSQNSPPKGTCRWMARELFMRDDARHTTYSDIWAFGCVALELISGERPFCTISKDQQVIIALYRGDLPYRPQTVPDSMWRLMLECWTLEPTDRPSVHAILQRMLGESLVDLRCSAPWSMRNRIVRSVSPWSARARSGGRRTCSPHQIFPVA